MEHFGAFITQLRKEQGLTQKELAQKLNVTDKAVSKWETDRGFPDIQQLEPLAQALVVSLVELVQGKRREEGQLTVAQAEAVVAQAMDRSRQTTAGRYLRLFRWVLGGIAALCGLALLPWVLFLFNELYFRLITAPQIGVIGGASGPTSIVTTSSPSLFQMVGLPLILLVVCLILFLRVGRAGEELK